MSLKKLIVCMVFCLLCCLGAIARADSTENGIEYYVDEQGAHITAYNGSEVHLIVPDTLDGVPVVSIGLDGSRERSTVARITLPSSVVKLDDYAFNGFDSLIRIDGLEYIQQIGHSAFIACAMQNLTFSDALEHIGSHAFSGSALTHLSIPNDVTYDDAAIYSWTLEEIILTDGNSPQTLALKDGVLFNADFTHLVAYPIRHPRASYTIPDGVKIVEWCAFDNAGQRLMELYIPASVEKIVPANYNILGKLTLYVYEGTAGHNMALFLEEMYGTTDRFEYVLIDANADVESLDAYVHRIVAEVTNAGMSNYQKALALHDWLIAHAEYDYTFTHTTAYDILKKGQGICCAYADAYYWLLSTAGIKAQVVGNFDHALVAAYLNGSWTFIDPTHNDGADHNYFGMNDAMFKYRYGAIYPDHFNNMIVVTDKLDATSVKNHVWYREGRHTLQLERLIESIRLQLAQGQTNFVIEADDSEAFITFICAGVVTEDGVEMNGQTYEVICTVNEQNNWHVYLPDSNQESLTDFKYEILNGKIRITAYTGDDAVVIIPESINGLLVAYIGDASFRMNYSLEEVVFPEGLIEIEGNAFYKCLSLKTINIPSTLQYIGQEAFDCCYKLESDIILPDGFLTMSPQAFEQCTSITRVHLNGSFGDCAFAECEKLATVTFGNNVEMIPASMFSGCSALKSITLPEALWYIGPNAFYRTGLESIHIPAKVSLMGIAPFQECNALRKVTVSEENQSYQATNGIIYSSDGKTLHCATAAFTEAQFEVPKTVETIVDRAFFAHPTLSSIYIPSNVKTIQREAFQDCTKLRRIFIADGCTQIGMAAFVSYNTPIVTDYVRFPATLAYAESHLLSQRLISSFVIPFSLTVMPNDSLSNPSTTEGITLYTHRNVTHLGNNLTGNSDLFKKSVIYGYKDSAIETWVEAQGLTFIPYTITELPVMDISAPGASATISGLPEHYAMRWYSSDTSIATVDSNGKVIAHRSGTVTLEGEVETKHATLAVFRCKVVIPDEGHELEIDSAVAPTCSTPGLTEGRHCRICGETILVQAIIPALGHKVVIDAEVWPTCTTTGLTEGEHCAVCEEVIVPQDVIPAYGHAEGAPLVTVEPSETTAGVQIVQCMNCNEILHEEIIPATGISQTPGDVNGDSLVDLTDALLILQHSAGNDITLNLTAADVDDSGTVDIMDALRILQYTAGWNVALQ